MGFLCCLCFKDKETKNYEDKHFVFQAQKTETLKRKERENEEKNTQSKVRKVDE